MAITFGIVAIIAIVFILLYMKENEKCENLKYDNEKLKKDAAQAGIVSAAACEYDSRRLDRDLIMETIRYNGFVPEAEDNWIFFKKQGDTYGIVTERLPTFIIMRHYDLDKKEWNMELLRQAAHKVSDEIIMAKVLLTGEDEDGISFQITSFEDNYDHLKDFLCQYLSIIDESYARLFDTYNELENKKSEMTLTNQGQSLNMAGSKRSCLRKPQEKMMDALDNFTNHGHGIWQPRRVQGIFVCSTPTFEERVGHGRMGHRCVYGRVACPWFVKRRYSAPNH